MREKCETLKQTALYLLVGSSSALIELTLFYVLSNIFSASLALSNIVSMIAAMAFNFIANGTATFRSTSRLSRSAVLYLMLFCFNAVFSTAAINLLTSVGLAALFAKIATMGCIVFWNFILYKKVIFI